jgi:hypothetical protein
VSCGLVPFALIIETAVVADGAKNVIAGGGNLISLFNDVLKGEAETAATAGEQTCGMGMTIEGIGVGDFMVPVDPRNGAPLEEGFLDGLAFRVLADGAKPLMALEIRDGLGFD